MLVPQQLISILPCIQMVCCRDGDSRRKKKRKADGEIEALFSANSKRSKQWLEEDSKALLPIKDRNKLVQRSQKVENVLSKTGGHCLLLNFWLKSVDLGQKFNNTF